MFEVQPHLRRHGARLTFFRGFFLFFFIHGLSDANKEQEIWIRIDRQTLRGSDADETLFIIRYSILIYT